MPNLRILLAVLAIVIATAAEAHALLLSFALQGQDVLLQYNGRVDATRSRVSLFDPADPHPRKLDSGGGEDPATLRVHLGALAPGSYVLRWEVLSVDGHISRGDQPLVVPQP